MRNFVVSGLFFLSLFAACGADRDDECGVEGTPQTIEQCECVGGTVAPNPGAGATCPEGTEKASDLPGTGIELSACCL